jgi:hypothetical protein
LGNIILIRDILNSRKRKEEELKFYEKQLSTLENRLALIRHEINLTNKILVLIRKDEVIEVKNDSG